MKTSIKLAVFIISGFILCGYALGSTDIKNDNIKVSRSEYTNNEDVVGWLSIEGIKDFNFPVVKGDDNDFYLNHNYNKEEYKYGSVFMDYRVNIDSKKVLIYGHSSKQQTTYFNSLENFSTKSYYDKHKYIYFKDNKVNYKYEIFSVYVALEDFTYMNINISNWYEHLTKLKNNSIYDTGINVNEDDNILILQTCSNDSKYEKYAKKYLLIIARRI